MSLHLNIETFILLGGALLSIIGSIFIMRTNWKQYGLLFIAVALVGELLDYLFVKLGFYSYDYKLFHDMPNSPYSLIMTLFPFYILFGVKYSPRAWNYKLLFYMTLVHIGMTGEVLAGNFTRVINYHRFWDTWDSYIWWWLFALAFETIGSLIVSEQYRTPIKDETFKFGNLGWYFTHFIFITTIFLGGIFLGTKL